MRPSERCSGGLAASAGWRSLVAERRTRDGAAAYNDAPEWDAALVGHETVTLVGIRDPDILQHLDAWVTTLRQIVTQRAQVLLELEPDEFQLDVRCYGANAILGRLEPETAAPREVGVLFRVRAADQATATAIAKIANPYLLHLPLPAMTHLPSFAFAMSPAEIERGPVYEFVLNHAVDVADPQELLRTVYTEVNRG